MKSGFCLILCFVVVFESISAQSFENAIKNSVDLIEKFKTKELIPGLGVGVQHKGKHIWTQSFGYSDVENGVPFSAKSVLRTGSLSKGIETAVVAKLVEQNKISWDSEIHGYVSEKSFPKKQWNGMSEPFDQLFD